MIGTHVVELLVVELLVVEPPDVSVDVKAEIILSAYLIPLTVFSSTTVWPLRIVIDERPPVNEPPLTLIWMLPAETESRANAFEADGNALCKAMACEAPLIEIAAPA